MGGVLACTIHTAVEACYNDIVRRLSSLPFPQDLMAKDRAASRLSQLTRFSPNPRGAHGVTSRLVSLVATTVLRASHLVSDQHRNALMIAVFGFKVGATFGKTPLNRHIVANIPFIISPSSTKALEWWFTSAEERLAVSRVLPPPPPPPMPRPSTKGVGLPSDPKLCPICRYEDTIRGAAWG